MHQALGQTRVVSLRVVRLDEAVQLVHVVGLLGERRQLRARNRVGWHQIEQRLFAAHAYGGGVGRAMLGLDLTHEQRRQRVLGEAKEGVTLGEATASITACERDAEGLQLDQQLITDAARLLGQH